MAISASNQATLDQFMSCWEGLEDPRSGNASLHDLYELLMIALCTVLCGGQGAVDRALFAKAKEPFLRSFLKLENGLPSHDTFSRLFRNLDPEQFRACFQQFMAEFSAQCQGVVAIDGKVLRRSFDRASGKSALHMVSAWGWRRSRQSTAASAASSSLRSMPAGTLPACFASVPKLRWPQERPLRPRLLPRHPYRFHRAHRSWSCASALRDLQS